MIFNKINKDVFLKWFLIVWSAFVFCFMAFVNKPQIYADGFEYAYMTESFIQHNTPEVQETDYKISQNKLTKQGIPLNVDAVTRGFFVGNNGEYYSYHFWLYPLVVSPVQQVMKVFRGNELRAFGVTNAILYIAMLWVIFYFVPQKHRFLLIGLMAFSPLIPYIRWIHTEVFSATLVTMGLVFWLRKNYKLALLFSSLALCQNPPIVAFTIWVGCAYLYNVYKQYRETKKIDLFDFMITGLCALPIVFSPLFYYIRFGTFNLIKAAGHAHFNLISFSKFLSYFFDLNQGAILYSGILLLVFIYYIIKNLAHKNLKHFEFVIWVVAFAILCLPTPCWNCGESVVIRYWTWAYPLIAFYVAYNINIEKRHILTTVLLVNMIGLCFINNWFEGDIRYLNYNLLSRTVLNYVPSLYTPVHHIFHCRTNRKCAGAYPVIFTNPKDEARKILTNKTAWQSLKDNEEYAINDMAFYEQELAKFKDNRLKYINVYGNKITKLATLLEIKNKISFNEIDKDIYGLSIKESWGRWSDSKTTKFRLKFLSLNKKSENIVLKINGHPFINNKHKSQKIGVFVNNKHVAKWNFEYGKPAPDTTITIPKSELQNSNICELRFEIEKPRSPKELSLSEDHRKLGFGFESIEIVKK